MNRERMKMAGYDVHERSGHWVRSWDWSAPNKGPMNSRHFPTEEAAWRDAEEALKRELERMAQLMALVLPDAHRKLMPMQVENLNARFARIVSNNPGLTLNDILQAVWKDGHDVGWRKGERSGTDFPRGEGG